MNDLIDSIFGDTYITLECEGGECIHYSQVPGYVVGFMAIWCAQTRTLICFDVSSGLLNPKILSG